MPTQLTLVNTVTLARRLNSADDAERQKAQADLQVLIRDKALLLKRVHKLMIGNIIAGSIIGLVLVVWGVRVENPYLGVYMIVWQFAIHGISYLIRLWKNKIGRTIAALDIPQAVGPLIEICTSAGLYRFSHIKAALIRLLPRLQATDAGLLTLRQRKSLYKILGNDEYLPYYGRYWGADLKVAILRALEQIGDEKAIPSVEKAARSARNPQVRTAAQECLHFLQQRAEQTRTEQTLLRASTATTSSDMLLRPTAANTSTEPQQLLRASNTENNANFD